MRASNAQGNFSDDRQREHQRQQERLKAMVTNSDKSQMVSADVMIENLLKDSFKKLPQTTSPVNQLDHPNSELPLWLQCDSAVVPAQYKCLWTLVQSTPDLADTQKVSQLLLTSGLHLDLLGFIWNLANKAIPGQLTKQEFYIVLALVGLAQTGYTFNNLSILKLITIPSIPALQVGLQNYSAPQPYAQSMGTTNPCTFNGVSSSFAFPSMPCNSESEKDKNHLFKGGITETTLSSDLDTSLVNQKEIGGAGLLPTFSSSNIHQSNTSVIHQSNTSEPNLSDQTKGVNKSSNFPCIGSSPTAEYVDDFSAFQSVSGETTEDPKTSSQSAFDSGDDFTEFQSANIEHLDPFETVIINQKREIPKIPLPKSFSGKFSNLKSNILKISPETEKKLKVLSPTESLSSLPESKISSSNKVSTSISVLGSNQGIGSRLANHSFNSKLERPKCHKHHKIKINPISPPNPNSDEEIILGVKPRNLDSIIPKCRPKSSSTCKTFILKETKIRSNETGGSSLNEQVASEIDPPTLQSGENTRQIEIPMLGTFNETVLPTQTKSQNSGIDLISVQEDKYSALREINLELNQEKNLEVKEVNDDFGDFLSADIPPPVTLQSTAVESLNLNPEVVFEQNEEKEDWGDWNFSTETSSSKPELATIPVFDIPQTSIFTDINESSSFKPQEDLFDSFASLTVNEKQPSQPEPDLLEHQDQFWFDTKVDTTSEVNIFSGKNDNSNDVQVQPKVEQTPNPEPDNEFWEFLSSDIKPVTEETYQRQGSLPSLDLKISPTDESEQEGVWRKCLDSCHGLIQEGYDVFNNIHTKSVFDEVFAAPKTEDYLNYLNTAFQISKRVAKNFNALPTTLEDLERLWGRLQDLCFEYNIKLKHDEDSYSEGKVLCNICLSRIGLDIISQGNGSYHPSCANLWINCVEGILPFSV